MPFKYLFGNLGSPAKSTENKRMIWKISSEVTIEFSTPSLRIYETLEDLKKNDPLFLSLPNVEKERLLKEENICLVKGFILMPLNKNVPEYTGQFLQHVLFGDVYNQKVLGMHHKGGLIENSVEINQLLTQPDKNGVYKVEIRKKDSRHKKDNQVKEWRLKKTTFFPDEWDWDRLYEECEHAFHNKSLLQTYSNSLLWKSLTKSNVPVEIYTDSDGRFQTIYPVFQEG